MTFTKPKVDEGNERELLKDWEWGHDVTPLDKAALNGANVVLDQIKADASIFLYADNGDRIKATVNLFGDYFLVFDITEDLKELASEDDISQVRKVWECEIQDKKNLSDLFHSLGHAVDKVIEKIRANGTLDEQMGMSHEEWEAAGKPDISLPKP